MTIFYKGVWWGKQKQNIMATKVQVNTKEKRKRLLRAKRKLKFENLAQKIEILQFVLSALSSRSKGVRICFSQLRPDMTLSAWEHRKHIAFIEARKEIVKLGFDITVEKEIIVFEQRDLFYISWKITKKAA